MSQIDSNGVELGANVTLTVMAEMFRDAGSKYNGLRYLADTLAPHIETIAGTPIRNVIHV